MNYPYAINATQAIAFIKRLFFVGLVPYLHSSPGIGKSQIIKGIAKEMDLKVIDIRLSQCDPADLNGFPSLVDGVATYLPFDLFPTENTPLPDGYDGWVVFLDEFSSAPRSVQAAAYKILLDKMVGNHKLHPSVVLVAAGNLKTDRAITNPISTASQSRMVHLVLKADYSTWLQNVAAPLNYDERIISFLSQYPEKLMDFDPDHEDLTYACSRTWEFVNKLLTDEHAPPLSSADTPLFAGTIGATTATEFISFCDVYKDLVKIEDVIADPAGCRIPDKISAKWAISTRIATHLKASNADALMKYAARFDMPFRVLTIRMLVAKSADNMNIPGVQNAAIDLADHLYS